MIQNYYDNRNRSRIIASFGVIGSAPIQASTLVLPFYFRNVNGSINCNVMYVLMAYNRIGALRAVTTTDNR